MNKTEICVKVGDVSYSFDVDVARAIYLELHKLFGEKEAVLPSTSSKFPASLKFDDFPWVKPMWKWSTTYYNGDNDTQKY